MYPNSSRLLLPIQLMSLLPLLWPCLTNNVLIAELTNVTFTHITWNANKRAYRFFELRKQLSCISPIHSARIQFEANSRRDYIFFAFLKFRDLIFLQCRKQREPIWLDAKQDDR